MSGIIKNKLTQTISRDREIVCVCAKIKPTKVQTTTMGGQESAVKWQQTNGLIMLQWTQSLVENVRALSLTHTHAYHTTHHTTHHTSTHTHTNTWASSKLQRDAHDRERTKSVQNPHCLA